MFRNGVSGAKDILGLIDKAWRWMNNSKEKFLCSLVPHIPICITPDGISWSRILSAVAIAIMLFWYEDCRWYIIVLFIVAIIGDVFDGPIARYRDIETPTGALLDRAGDKLLVCPMILRLLWIYHPMFAIGMVIAEAVALLALKGRESEWLAKYKMAAESIGVLILLFLPFRVTWAFSAFVASMGIGLLSIISGARSRTA